MLRNLALALLAAGPALAGCLAPAAPLDAGFDAAAGPLTGATLLLGGATAAGAEALRVAGRELAAPPGPDPQDDGRFLACLFTGIDLCRRDVPCTEAACDRHVLELAVPEGFEGAALEIAVQPLVDEPLEAWFDLRVAGPGGLALRGAGYETAQAFLPDPPAGTYTIEAVAMYGTALYELVAQLEPVAARAEGDLLPDLVSLAPRHLRVATPMLGHAALDALGFRACGADEVVHDQPRRCLRFSSYVANLGEGPLEVRLAVEQGPAGVLGEGRFTQRVYAADGSARDLPAGAARFHATHAHFHYAGLVDTALHAYDADAMARGERVTEWVKRGFCFADIGMVDAGRAGTAARAYHDARPCIDPTLHGSWRQGLMPGWYDVYPWSIPDQYIDIAGLGDGVYELVSVIDRDATLAELDRTNNEASVVFQMHGDIIEVLA